MNAVCCLLDRSKNHQPPFTAVACREHTQTRLNCWRGDAEARHIKHQRQCWYQQEPQALSQPPSPTGQPWPRRQLARGHNPSLHGLQTAQQLQSKDCEQTQEGEGRGILRFQLWWIQDRRSPSRFSFNHMSWWWHQAPLPVACTDN